MSLRSPSSPTHLHTAPWARLSSAFWLLSLGFAMRNTWFLGIWKIPKCCPLWSTHRDGPEEHWGLHSLVVARRENDRWKGVKTRDHLQHRLVRDTSCWSRHRERWRQTCFECRNSTRIALVRVIAWCECGVVVFFLSRVWICRWIEEEGDCPGRDLVTVENCPQSRSLSPKSERNRCLCPGRFLNYISRNTDERWRWRHCRGSELSWSSEF